MKHTRKPTILLLLLVLLNLSLSGCVREEPQPTEQEKTYQYVPLREELPFGVWWWRYEEEMEKHYLEFVVAQGITEIYFGAAFLKSYWCDDVVRNFIAAARGYGIAVYYLTGDWSWIHDDTGLIARLEAFHAYQESACEMTRFAGVHLNIEPHQDPNWNTDTRNELLQSYVDLKVRITDRFGRMDWTVPFWYREEIFDLITHRDGEEYVYRAVLLEANRVFVMSYRNTAQATYEIATHYIAFAREIGRPIFLSALVDPGSECSEHNHVFFYDLGHTYMMRELAQLREIVDHPALGIAVHEIRGWYRMWTRESVR